MIQTSHVRIFLSLSVLSVLQLCYYALSVKQTRKVHTLCSKGIPHLKNHSSAFQAREVVLKSSCRKRLYGKYFQSAGLCQTLCWVLGMDNNVLALQTRMREKPVN